MRYITCLAVIALAFEMGGCHSPSKQTPNAFGGQVSEATMPDPGAAAGCPSDAGITNVPDPNGAIDPVIRNGIYRALLAEAGTPSSNASGVGVHFTSLNIDQGQPDGYTTAGPNTPDAVPGSKIYTAEASMDVCWIHSDGPAHEARERTYYCHMSKMGGGWRCST